VVGVTVSNYLLLEKIGEGGTGSVYRAEHKLIGRKAAVKVLLPDLSLEPDFLRRFFTEAKLTAQLRHPGIVGIWDFGYTDDQRAYIVMELLEGESLRGKLRRERRLPFELSIQLARQLASALDATHKQGIIHRDLKPENIFVVPDPEIPCGLRTKLLDFGIAKLAEQLSGSAKTLSGVFIGTPVYASPEQCSDASKVDARSDLYSLACILFEMLCGCPPFQPGIDGGLLTAHMIVLPPSPRLLEPSIPKALEEILLRALAKSPSARYADMASLGAALEEAFPEHLTFRSAPAPLGPIVDVSDGQTILSDEQITIGAEKRYTTEPDDTPSHFGRRKRRRGRSKILLAAAGGAALTLGVVSTLGVLKGTDPAPPPPPAASAPAETPRAAASAPPSSTPPTPTIVPLPPEPAAEPPPREPPRARRAAAAAPKEARKSEAARERRRASEVPADDHMYIKSNDL
jgi:serine/threonine protein kinase